MFPVKAGSDLINPYTATTRPASNWEEKSMKFEDDMRSATPYTSYDDRHISEYVHISEDFLTAKKWEK